MLAMSNHDTQMQPAPGAMTESNASGLRMVLRVLLVVLPTLLGVMILAGMPLAQQLIMCGMVFWNLLAWLQFRSGRREASIATVVFGLIAFGTAFSAAYGSIRSIGTAVSLAGVAAAGVYLDRRQLFAAAAISALAVGGLVIGERTGYMGPPAGYEVGLVHWIAYVTIFGCVGLGAYHARVLLLRALEQAQRSAEHLARLFDMVPVALVLTRAADGRILEVNAADERHSGYRRDERVGNTSLALSWSDPAERARFIALLEAKGRVAGLDAKHRNKAGELIDVQLWAAPLDYAGERCIVTSVLNVTAAKREERLLLDTAAGVAGETGERLFRTLVQHLASTLECQIAICGEFGPGGGLAPEGVLHALAMVKDGEAMPHAQLDVAGTPCDDLPLDGSIAFASTGIGSLYPATADAFVRRVEGHVGMLLRDAHGKPLGVLSAFSYQPLERTARLDALFRIFAARAEAELRHLRHDREIQRLNRRLENRVRERTADLESFSYAVSHDLKGPLDSVVATSSALRHDYGGALPPEALRYLDRIDLGATQMRQLVDGLTEFSRLGLESAEPASVDMEALVRQEMGALPRTRRVRFEIARLPSTFGEPRLLALVWRHLLDNAVKFSRHAAEPIVRIAAQAEGGGVRYSVSDNGAGFDARHADRLFKVFERLHSSDEYEGTGIGLAIVKRIVTRHGGTVDANGLPHGGATFAFTLPGSRRAVERVTQPGALAARS